MRRTVLRAVSALSSPLLPDDYLELIDPLWSTRELRGRIEEVRHETADAATVLFRPGHDWPGHEPGHTDDVIFGPELRALAAKHGRFKLHEQLTRESGRMGPADLDRLCPDWRERAAHISGPAEMLDAFEAHYEEHGLRDRLCMERFQPKLDGGGEPGTGGSIKFLKSQCETESDGTKPILVAGEDEGLDLPYGCREGTCHTCVGTLVSGRVRDLRNGQVYGNDGEQIRTCISAPEGPVEIDL